MLSLVGDQMLILTVAHLTKSEGYNKVECYLRIKGLQPLSSLSQKLSRSYFFELVIRRLLQSW